MYLVESIVLSDCEILFVLDAFSQACTNHRAYIDYNFIIYVVIAAVTYMLILVLKDAVIRSGSRWLQCLLHKREPDSNRNGSTTDNKGILLI